MTNIQAQKVSQVKNLKKGKALDHVNADNGLLIW